MDIKNIYNELKGERKGEIGKYFSSEEFNSEYGYTGELGSIFSKSETTFKLWSPVAKKVTLELFNKDDLNFIKKKEVEMKEENRVWTTTEKGNLNRTYYRYKIEIEDKINYAVDPYSKAVSANGEYSMVIDLEMCNPKGWEEDIKPLLKDATDSIIYEMHIRDFTIDKNSGVKNKGKYKGLYEKDTKLKGSNIKTGLDHLKELGITHIHLLPTFDYKSVDEKNLHIPQYNWGYDPENYNCLEGSYSLDPFNGESRVCEFKDMVLNLHKEGLRVIMDVVYNHTFEGENSLFNKVVPYYYYREDEKGNFSNGSACGNETASDRMMFRKFMVDSVVHFAKEYHIDGFRFDLMGLHDIETMTTIREELDKIDKSILIYGEGWTGGETPLKEEDRALKKNTVKYGSRQIAAFSDDIRDGVKGDVFIEEKKGFANGGNNFEETIKCGIVASIDHEDVDYSKVLYSETPWANEPYQTITYASAHDNYTLWDKLNITCKGEKEETLIKMNKLIASIILTSQGISFIHSGEEILRTKVNEEGKLIENSYNSSDFVNKIYWNRKEEYKEVFNYYKDLIKIRKGHKAFRMNTSEDIRNNLQFINLNEENIVAYRINGDKVNDIWKNILVIFNGNREDKTLEIPKEKWKLVFNEEGIVEESLVENRLKVSGISCNILVC